MSEDNVAAEQLRLFGERIERLEEEKKGIADDVKDVIQRPKSAGDKIADHGAGNADWINAVVVIKARILSRKNSIHKVVGDLIKGNDDPVFSGQPAVEFSILVINRRALGHVADRSQVEGQRPGVEEQRDNSPKQDNDHRRLY